MAALDDKLSLPGEVQPARGVALRVHALRGSAWTVAWRWSVRLIGVVNTVVLARLLTPRDFGIYAMGMLVIGLIGIFGESGQSLALIRLGKPTREHYDTAWTIQFVVYTFLALCAVASAPVAAAYFHSDVIQSLILFLSLRLFISGLSNIAVVSFRINLDYAKDFRFGVYQKLATAAITISCAFVLRDYWALAIAVVVSKVIGVVLSYGMHPYRPRFSLSKAHEIWAFSLWMLIVFVSEYLARKTDEFVVGATNSASAMGAYSVGADVALMPTAELTEPIARALFPIYSRLLDDPVRLRATVLMVLGATGTVCFATGPGVASIAPEFTQILLGAKWGDSAPLVFWIAIGAVAYGLNYNIYSILSVTNNARLTAISIWVRIALLVPILLFAASWGGLPAIAAAQALIGFLVLFLDFFMLRRAVGTRIADIVGCLYRPATASLLMVLTVELLDGATQLPLAFEMVFKIICGGIVYIGSLAIVWLAAGRPDGIEASVIASASNIVRGGGHLTTKISSAAREG